jgi:hypothetical protein
VATQRELTRRLRKQYPTVTQHLSTEVSMVRHMNVFMENLELYPYPDRGKAPVLDGSVEAARAMVDWYHDRGALVQYNHPPAASLAELVATRALGTDLAEIASSTGGFDARITWFDVAARNAIFLTATSQIDDHNGRDWLGLRHLWLTRVRAASRGARDLLAGLAAGQAWLYSRELWPAGVIDISLGRRRVMGRVVSTAATHVPLEVTVENLPAGATVDMVVGVCDRSGAIIPSIERRPYRAELFAGRPLPFRLDRGDGSYLRVEVRDASGTLIGFSNPVWVLPTDADVEVPPARRFREG